MNCWNTYWLQLWINKVLAFGLLELDVYWWDQSESTICNIYALFHIHDSSVFTEYWEDTRQDLNPEGSVVRVKFQKKKKIPKTEQDNVWANTPR